MQTCTHSETRPAAFIGETYTGSPRGQASLLAGFAGVGMPPPGLADRSRVAAALRAAVSRALTAGLAHGLGCSRSWWQGRNTP